MVFCLIMVELTIVWNHATAVTDTGMSQFYGQVRLHHPQIH